MTTWNEELFLDHDSFRFASPNWLLSFGNRSFSLVSRPPPFSQAIDHSRTVQTVLSTTRTCFLCTSTGSILAERECPRCCRVYTVVIEQSDVIMGLKGQKKSSCGSFASPDLLIYFRFFSSTLTDNPKGQRVKGVQRFCR